MTAQWTEERSAAKRMIPRVKAEGPPRFDTAYMPPAAEWDPSGGKDVNITVYGPKAEHVTKMVLKPSTKWYTVKENWARARRIDEPDGFKRLPGPPMNQQQARQMENDTVYALHIEDGDSIHVYVEQLKKEKEGYAF